MKTIWLPLCAIMLASCGHSTSDPEPQAVVSVKAVRAERANIWQTVTAPATVFPREQANISARTTAPIRELRVRKGDTVHAGQILAVLENRDVAAQRQEAEAVLQDAEANLQKTTSGTVPGDIERAKGQLETARATLDQAQKNYERRRQLFAEGAIPQRDLLQTETDLATARANHEVARRALALLEQQSGGRDIAIARARVEQARARLAAATANLQYTELRSPFAGNITEQFQYSGDMAGPGTPTYTLMDLSVVTARAQVPDNRAGRVRVGQPCSFAAADNDVSAARGTVTVVNRAVDPARRTVEVWCEIRKPSTMIRAGVFGSASIDIGTIAGAIVVPVSAVQINEGTATGLVFVVDEKHIAHKRDVQIGLQQQDRIQIVSGVAAGEMVITEGGYALPDGIEVRLAGYAPKGAK